MDVDSLQLLMGRGWPGLEQQALGEWVLRAGAGFTGRANSCLPVGDPGVPTDEALTHVEEWYAARGLPPKFQVPFPATGPADPAPGIDTLLAERGYDAEPVTLVMIADPADLALGESPSGLSYDWTDTTDDGWLARYHYRGGDLPVTARRVITAAPAGYLTARLDGEVIGIGRAAPTDDWVGLQAIEIDPAFRRRGLGSALTLELVRWGVMEGAAHVYLQMFAHNPAVTMYRALGFQVHHRYHYRFVSP